MRKGKRDPEARALSGGNLQKFVVGREMTREPKVLIINQPTWGVDAGAAALIRQALIDLARSGSAVLVISQDLDEIYEIADRIAVISRGELSQSYRPADMSLEQIGLLMAGAHERGNQSGRKGKRMKIILEKRSRNNRPGWPMLSPLIAIGLTVLSAASSLRCAVSIRPMRSMSISSNRSRPCGRSSS